MKKWIIILLVLILCSTLATPFIITNIGVDKNTDESKQPATPDDGLTDTVVDEVVMVRNPHNLIKPEDLTFADGGYGSGFKISHDSEGVVSLEGASITKDGSLELGRFRLAPGTYTFTATDFYDLNNYCVKVRAVQADGSTTVLAPTTTTNTFTLTEPKEIVIIFYFKAGYVLNDYNRFIYPVLVEGTKEQSFYIEQKAAASLVEMYRNEWYNVTIKATGEKGPTVSYYDLSGELQTVEVVEKTYSFIVYSRSNEVSIVGYEDDYSIINGDVFGKINVTGDLDFKYSYGAIYYNVLINNTIEDSLKITCFDINGSSIETYLEISDKIEVVVPAKYNTVIISLNDVDNEYTITANTTINIE
ncbi:MAG: hypothetical protein E7653_00175 [Ruminococcaceae bacterium]|nr:hypothetical protein [Oscillospiraceae bacterium]